MARTYVAWNDPNVEPRVDDEAGKINEVCGVIEKVQDHNFAQHRHGFRGTHVKTQAIVKGSMKVLRDLPAHLSQGI